MQGCDDLAAIGVCTAWEASRRVAPPRDVLSGNFPHGPERRHPLELGYIPLLHSHAPGYHPPAHPETGAGLNRGSANAFLQSLPQAIGSHAAAPATPVARETWRGGRRWSVYPGVSEGA
jgi:hypothetical protein